MTLADSVLSTDYPPTSSGSARWNFPRFPSDPMNSRFGRQDSPRRRFQPFSGEDFLGYSTVSTELNYVELLHTRINEDRYLLKSKRVGKLSRVLNKFCGTVNSVQFYLFP